MKKKMILGTMLLMLILSLFLYSCAGPEVIHADDSQATPEKVGAVVQANNQFAFDLYAKYNAQEGNIFFSPYSVSTALAMTYEGARGQTAEEMQKVFYFPEESVRRPGSAKIYNDLNKRDKDYQLNTANALWAQKDYQFSNEFLQIVESYYGGKVTNLDFVGETEKSRITINNWVEEQTNGKIKDLISPSGVNAVTRLILTNAVYFKGDWVLKFDKKKTHEADFKSPGQTVKAQMMSLAGEKAKFNYIETEELQMIELPYEGEELSMLILLPKEETLGTLEKSLSLTKLNEWKKGLQEEKIDVYLPKFKFETKYLMAGDLAGMGMPTAFTWPGADFSGMDGTKNLYIGQVIHQAYVEVDEEGTEAAAATAVMMMFGAARSNLFMADHPFIFIIQEKATGNILFLGRVTDPTK